MNQKYAKYLLEKTAQDYNTISERFSKTRNQVWEEVETLVEDYVLPQDRILDLGCGNGRLVKVLQEKPVDYIGVDVSEKLIKIAKEKHPKKRFLQANALDLPFPANYFDKIFSIAVLHHIPSTEFRLKFLKQAKRVLKPEGLLILTVWNLWRKKFLKYHLKYNFLKLIGKSKLDWKDIFYPWKSPNGKVVVQRYLHCFTKGELKRLVQKADFEIKGIGFLGKDNRNIGLVAKEIDR